MLKEGGGLTVDHGPLVFLLPVKPSLLGTAAIHVDNRPESKRRKEAERRWVESEMHST